MHEDKPDKTPISPEDQCKKDELWKQFKAQFRQKARETESDKKDDE